MSAGAWSTPFFGVQHLTATHDSSVWATVADGGTFATCAVYTPGCGLRPARTMHESAEAARAHAERSLRRLSEVAA